MYVTAGFVIFPEECPWELGWVCSRAGQGLPTAPCGWLLAGSFVLRADGWKKRGLQIV